MPEVISQAGRGQSRSPADHSLTAPCRFLSKSHLPYCGIGFMATDMIVRRRKGCPQLQLKVYCPQHPCAKFVIYLAPRMPLTLVFKTQEFHSQASLRGTIPSPPRPQPPVLSLARGWVIERKDNTFLSASLLPGFSFVSCSWPYV